MSLPLFARTPTDKERHCLEAYLRGDDGELRRRARGILESSQGRTATEIARTIGTSPENIKRWIRGFNVAGPPALVPRKRGPEPRFTPDQIAALQALARRSPTDLGYDFLEWSAQKLAAAATERGIVESISHVTVRKFLTEDAPAPEASRPTPPSPDDVARRIARLEVLVNHSDAASDDGARLRCALSDAYESVGRYPEALAVVAGYESPDARVPPSPLWQAQTRLRLGWGYAWQGNHPRALARMNEALRLFIDHDVPDGVCAAQYAIGRTYTEINEFKIGRDRIWRGARDLGARLDSETECPLWQREGSDDSPAAWRRTLLARMHLSLGVIDFCEGNFEAAKKNYVRAMDLAGDATRDRNLLGLVAMNLALIHDQMGERREAKRYYERAIAEFTQGGHESFLARCHNNLGESLTHHGLWEEAAEHLETALAFAERHQARENEALTLITLAELRLLQGQFGIAETHLSRAVELLIDGDKWAEAYAQRVYGRLHLAVGREDAGLAKLQLALQMTTDLGDRHGICLSRLELARYYLDRDNLDEAESCLALAREALKNSSGFYAAGLAQRLTGKLEAARRRFAEAHQHLLQSISIFTANDDRYEVAVSCAEVGRVLLDLRDVAAARTQLARAEEIFMHLGAAAEAERVRAVHRTHGSETNGLPLPSMTPPSETLLLQRLIDACAARELLLRELASILHESFAALAVVVWETDVYTHPRVLLASPPEEGDRLVRRAEEIQEGGRRGEGVLAGEWTEALFEGDSRRIGLYVRCDPGAARLPVRALDPLLKQVRLGLEISVLRTSQAVALPPVAPPVGQLTTFVPGFIVSSPAMRDVVDQIRKIRTSDVTVLITGESGTGKELIARAIHAGSARRDAVFVPFNCTATPRDLIESQLFGHRRGAFTGAISNYSGIVRAASGGTLFLDEIGDLTLDVQPKLMRFLQEGEVQPLGETKPVKVDVRVLAATNVDLERAVNEGRFREDLFHRLNIIRIHVPPLRERRDEIAPLAAHYLEHFSKRDGKRDLRLSRETLDVLAAYDWSGNVRQLRNEIERLVAFSGEGTVIGVPDLSPDIRQRSAQVVSGYTDRSHRSMLGNGDGRTPPPSRADGTATITYPVRATLREAVERLEFQMISDALHRTNNNISRTARELGLSRRGLRLKMEQLGLTVNES